jgi:mevalonate kinase
MDMVKVSAPGNVFFFGEHSVVYERPALATAIDMRTRTEIEKRDDGKVIIDSEGYGKGEMSTEELMGKEYPGSDSYTKPLDPLFDLVKTFFQKTGFSSGLEIRISSDIPSESGGMSSSTAVLCSLLEALNQIGGKGIKPEEFFDWLYPFQVKIHGGKASGSEIPSGSMGGYNLVRIDKSGEKPKLERKNLGRYEYMIIIGDTKI